MNELKTLSSVFNFFKWLGLIVGCVCFLFAVIFIGLSDGDKSEVVTLLCTGTFGFVTWFSCWISKVFIDAFNHIVAAARKYTND